MITARGLLPFLISAVATLVAAPLGFGGQVFVIGTVLALAVVGQDWWIARHTPLEVERPTAGPFSIGRPNLVQLVVHSPAERAVRVEIADAPTATASLGPVEHRLVLAPHEQRVLDLELVPRRRGDFAFARVGARVQGPRGLTFSQRRFDQTAWTGLTWPDVLQLRDERLLPAGRRAGGLRVGRSGDRGREFESLRAYVPGDEYRRISWKATARRGSPVVANMQPERRQSLVLAVEAGRLMAGAGGDGLAKLDRAVNTCVMLSAVAREYDDAVGLMTFSERPRAALGPAARSGQLRRVIETLAPLEADLLEPDWRSALVALSRLAGTRSLILFFSDLHYVEADPLLAARLGALTRKHRVVFASVIDQSIAADAAAPVTDEQSLFRRGAAVGLLQRRRLAAAELAARGVHSLDVAPADLTAAVVAEFRNLRREDRI